MSEKDKERGDRSQSVQGAGKQRPGPRPALTPAQVEALRRRRRRRSGRPTLVALAAEFQVSLRTIDRALRGSGVYAFGEPVPPTWRHAPHRDRGRGGHGKKRET